MKRLYYKILLILLPILLILFIVPMSRLFKYQGLIENCANQGTWIYDRINSNEKPIDIVFLGTSHTINGMDDGLIERRNSDSLRAVNFGYCRFGRNFSYAMLKEILHAKKPKYVYVEVNEDEDRYSHNVFPMISPTSDVLLAMPFFNRDLFADFWNHFAYKVAITQDFLYTDKSQIPIYREHFGFASHPDTADVGFLNQIKLDRHKPQIELTTLERNFHMKFPRYYLKKLSELCLENNIKLTFYYVPAYGTPVKVPKESDTYKKYGKLLLPPDSVIENPNFWYDKSHLNQAGAEALSIWMSEEIEKNQQY